MVVYSQQADLGWLMTEFARRVPGVNHAIVVLDGLLVGHSHGFSRDNADAAAAITSGLASLAARSAQLMGGGKVVQIVVEMRGGFMFLMAGNDGTAFVAWADSACDIGMVAYELAGLVDQVLAAPTQPGSSFEDRL